jgi:putative FmdB family regulatory protein
MPIYEFTCEECGRTFDELVAMASASAAVPCPSCKSKRTKRNVSTFASRSASKPGGSASDGCSPSGGRRFG